MTFWPMYGSVRNYIPALGTSRTYVKILKELLCLRKIWLNEWSAWGHYNVFEERESIKFLLLAPKHVQCYMFIFNKLRQYSGRYILIYPVHRPVIMTTSRAGDELPLFVLFWTLLGDICTGSLVDFIRGN